MNKKNSYEILRGLQNQANNDDLHHDISCSVSASSSNNSEDDHMDLLIGEMNDLLKDDMLPKEKLEVEQKRIFQSNDIPHQETDVLVDPI